MPVASLAVEACCSVEESYRVVKAPLVMPKQRFEVERVPLFQRITSSLIEKAVRCLERLLGANKIRGDALCVAAYCPGASLHICHECSAVMLSLELLSHSDSELGQFESAHRIGESHLDRRR